MEETDYNRLRGRLATSEETPDSISLKDQEAGAHAEETENASRHKGPEYCHTRRQVEQPVASSTEKKPLWKRLEIVRRDDSRRADILLMRLTRPLKFLLFPVISWTGFSYGVVIVWLAIINATQSLLLANAPYNFSTISVGYTFFAPLVGTTLA